MDQLPTTQKQPQLSETLAPPTPPPQSPQPWLKGLWSLDADQVYHRYQPHAQKAKVLFQMVVGIILAIILLLKALNYFLLLFGLSFPSVLTPIEPLVLISYALFFSTGIELAYMLFTPGPDEAVEPVITGLAAAILLFLANSKLVFNTDNGFGLLLATLALAALFALKRYFFKKTPEQKG